MNHLSASAIEMFLRCPQQWAYRYMEDLKIPPSVSLVQGTSVHAAAEHNYAYKVETHEDLPADEVLDVARDAFKEREPEVEDWEDEKPGAALDVTVGLARVYHAELAPQVQPVSVEREFVLEHDRWLIPLLGYMDVEDERRVIDIKTAGKRKTQADLDTSLQGGIYLLAREQEGLPAAMEWHVAVKTKEPAAQVLTRERVDHEQTIALVERVEESVLVATKTGIFTPALPGSWWCSERFCGYWKRCPFGGGR